MAHAWQRLGYAVDVVDYRNSEFIPRTRYDFFISARTHLETIAARLNRDCIKIAHLDTSHFAFNNRATYQRLLATQERRGAFLPESMRLVEINKAIDCADFGIVLGNDVTAGTYRYAGKPLFTISVPVARDLPRVDAKDFSACRRSFLWIGSGGLVHKGLDLALEAFAGMPDMHLTICGPVGAEKGFESAYRAELYGAPNIHTVGWVDVAGAEFARIVNECVAVIYPSCAEGQAGSVVTCLRAGLLPVVSPETGVDTDNFGWLIDGASVENVRCAVRAVASTAPAELAARTYSVLDYAAIHNTPQAYAHRYGEILAQIGA
jgi:glycosyltransferase involved in cell wall biosynthesis